MGTQRSKFSFKATAVCIGILAAISQYGFTAIEETDANTSTLPVLQTQTQTQSVSQSVIVTQTAVPNSTIMTQPPVYGDVNGNGRFDFADIVAINQAVGDYAKYDLNKDGFLNMDDVTLAFNSMGNPDFAMDFNGNGRNDFADITALNTAISASKKFDFNKDGKLNFDDVKAAFNAIGASPTMTPKPVVSIPGDVNGNGSTDFADVVETNNMIPACSGLNFDLDKNGQINFDDVKYAFNNLSPQLNFDYNKNGRTDFADIVNFNNDLSKIAKADFNKDGSINQADVTALFNSLGTPAVQPTGDANGNGRLDFADMTTAWNLLGNTAKYDVNKDGKTNFADVQYAFKNGIPDLDGNGSGNFQDLIQLNKSIAQIQTIDMNQNGRLDYSDVILLWKLL